MFNQHYQDGQNAMRYEVKLGILFLIFLCVGLWIIFSSGPDLSADEQRQVLAPYVTWQEYHATEEQLRDLQARVSLLEIQRRKD